MEIRVVLIDKNSAFLKSAQRFLEKLSDVSATSISTAARNVESKLCNAAPDLVLLDIALPAAIRSRLDNAMYSLKKMPVVVVLSLHEKGTPVQQLRGLNNSALVNKADFVTEIVPIIATMRASAAAEPIV